MTINEMVQETHETAKSKGWWDTPPEMGTLLALVHSEVSEALEWARRGDLNTHHVTQGNADNHTIKPEGFPIELADIVIRVADICGRYDIDLERALSEKMAYNRTRPFKHGGKAF